jgi:hypothetical protein
MKDMWQMEADKGTDKEEKISKYYANHLKVSVVYVSRLVRK